MRILLNCILIVACAIAISADGAQVPSGRQGDVEQPMHGGATGARVVIDEGHFNFHTLDNRFAPFAELLRSDGFRVAGMAKTFSVRVLRDVDILVIANALNQTNRAHWALPVRSAFSSAEVAAVKAWVDAGGSLLLIADHFPFPGAVADLAKSFGVRFRNSFVLHNPQVQRFDVFTREAGSLRDHVVTRGREQPEAVPKVATFTGSAFELSGSARAILVFAEDYIMLFPQVAWEFDESTPRLDAEGYVQGAVLESGEGRVAVFGEAAMFTVQNAGQPQSETGFNLPEAEYNKQFILNVVRWLSGDL
jgi:hypothetical protein